MPNPTDDPTVNMTIDEKVTANVATAPATFDISQPVTPGHDMVINHLDGTQELGTGNEMLAVTAAEAASGQHVPLSTVQGNVAPETQHRSVSDPEVNGPDQAALQAEVAAQSAPVAEPETTAEPEAPVEESEEPEFDDIPDLPVGGSKPTSADVEGV